MSEIGDLRKEIRGDIRDVWSDVKDVGKEVANISGILENALPGLATKTYVKLEISKHKEEDRKSRDNHKKPSIPPGLWQASYKKWIAICGAITAIAATVTALAYAL